MTRSDVSYFKPRKKTAELDDLDATEGLDL
jgi:hypothetical protein